MSAHSAAGAPPTSPNFSATAAVDGDVATSLSRLGDFGVRSLVTHAIMAATLLAAVASAFLLEGRIGLVSFVAFLNFTAGMWVCQSIHSLGNTYAGGDYRGVIATLRRRTTNE